MGVARCLFLNLIPLYGLYGQEYLLAAFKTEFFGLTRSRSISKTFEPSFIDIVVARVTLELQTIVPSFCIID